MGEQQTLTKRRGLYVWVYSLRQLKQLRHYGSIIYASKHMKYVLLYVDEDDVTATMAKLKKLRFVKDVQPSARPDLATSYSQKSAADEEL
nr:YlbG family protein [Lacticaseibacillus zhaodongensis]